MMKKVAYIKRNTTHLTGEDKAILRILLEDNGFDNIMSALNEDYIGVTNMEHSDGKTLGSKSDFETKWDNSQKDKRSLGKQMKDFGRGFVKSLPSMALTAAVCWPAGVVMALGAAHDRIEKKVNNTLLNPITFADWIANDKAGEGSDNREKKKSDSSFGVAPLDSSKNKEKEDTPKTTDATKRVVKDSSAITAGMKKYYVELNNGEVLKLYAINEEEAKSQASALITSTKGKYDTMNELFEEGAHTYRAIMTDGAIIYLTAETKEKAISIANYTSSELKRFYTSIGVKEKDGCKVKTITDEGIIPIPAPDKIIRIAEETAPNPDDIYKLKANISKEFYTNEDAKVYTYKLRINFNTVFLCASSNDEAILFAKNLNKAISGYKGTILSFLTGSTSGSAWLVQMNDGDKYVICETPEGEDPKTKAMTMIAGKYKLMEKLGSKNVRSFLQTKTDPSTNIPTVKVASARHTEIPQKFKNLNTFVLTKITGGKEDVIYKSALAKDSIEKKTKELTPKRVTA